MTTQITTRTGKGAPLTHAEMDANLTSLAQGVDNAADLLAAQESQLQSILSNADPSQIDSFSEVVSAFQAGDAAVASSVAAEAAARGAADADLGASLASEAAQRAAADTANAQAIASEASRAQAAEGLLSASIATEAANRQAADAALAGSLAMETSQRQSADLALDGQISDLSESVTERLRRSAFFGIEAVIGPVSFEYLLDSVATDFLRSIEYKVQATVGGQHQFSELQLIHDGMNVYMMESETITTDSLLASFDAVISEGFVRLIASTVYPNTSIKAIRIGIPV